MTYRRHNRIDGLKHGPDEIATRQILEGAVVVKAAQRPAILMDRPSEDAKETGSGSHGLDDKQVADEGRVDKHDGELNDPEDEKSEEILGRNSGAGWECVGDALPAVAKDAAQGDRREHAAVKRLRGKVDDGDRGAHDDEQLGPGDARRGTDVHGEADMVTSGTTRVEDDDDTKNERADDGGQNAVPPLLLWRNKAPWSARRTSSASSARSGAYQSNRDESGSEVV